MIAEPLRQVLEATGYYPAGAPARGVKLGMEARRTQRRGQKQRKFRPDALWSAWSLTVYFKFEEERPSDDTVAIWRKEIWNEGSAPLLWVVCPDQTSLYNCFGEPKAEGDAAAHHLGTFHNVSRDLVELNSLAGRLAMETGQFWRHGLAKPINRRRSVDQRLLFDLRCLERDLVGAGLHRSRAQSLAGRAIFAQCLVDRGIVAGKRLERLFGQRALPNILRDRSAAPRLFRWLRKTFNGDMFPVSASAAKVPLKHLRRVADFLEGVDPATGRQALFPYQFEIIPVELLASALEQLACSADGAKGERGTARPALVSLVTREALDTALGRERVLDLACGSGVYLIDAFRQLVAKASGKAKPSRALIRKVLYRQVHGVDPSETAVRIAASCLYLAALELDPAPESPAALRFRPLIGKTLLVGDAHTIDKTHRGRQALTTKRGPKKFDIIVGNAPRAESLDFAARAMDFANTKTRFGLVLNALPFFSRNKSEIGAAHRVIKALLPVTLINFANQREWLFSNSSAPVVALFAHQRHDRAADQIEVVQVPWSPAGAQAHAFDISPSDTYDLPWKYVEQEPDLMKAMLFGQARDITVLDKIRETSAPLRERLEEIGTRLRLGLASGRRDKDASYLQGLPFLKGRLEPLSLPSDLPQFDSAIAERTRGRETYAAPLLLIRERLQDGPRLIAAVAEDDMVFSDAYLGASLGHGHLDTAHLLAGILSSAFASWYFIMTASTFGLSQRRLLLADIAELPVPHLQSAVKSDAGKKVIELARQLRQRAPSDEDWNELDEAVFDLYGLKKRHRIIVRDGLFHASCQWESGQRAALEPATESDLCAYAKALTSVIDGWLSSLNIQRMRAEIYSLQDQDPLRIIRFVLENGPLPSRIKVVQPKKSLRELLDEFGKRLNFPIDESLIRNCCLREYSPTEVVIVRSAARRDWLPGAGFEEAGKVVVESFTGRRE